MTTIAVALAFANICPAEPVMTVDEILVKLYEGPNWWTFMNVKPWTAVHEQKMRRVKEYYSPIVRQDTATLKEALRRFQEIAVNDSAEEKAYIAYWAKKGVKVEDVRFGFMFGSSAGMLLNRFVFDIPRSDDDGRRNPMWPLGYDEKGEIVLRQQAPSAGGNYTSYPYTEFLAFEKKYKRRTFEKIETP